MSNGLNKSLIVSDSQTKLFLSGYLDGLKNQSFEEYVDALFSIADETVRSNDFHNTKNVVREFIASNLKVALETYASDVDSAKYLVYANKINAFLFAHPLFLNTNKEDISNASLFSWMQECRNKALLKKDFRYAPEIIVSFTSFPARIGTVYKTLSSIYKQTMLPSKVILWLAKPQFPKMDEELPESLLEYKQLGLDIRWVEEDLRPHKKYFYVMQEYPDALIITIDDDLLYDPYMIETLFTSYLHFPEAVSSVRSHLMVQDETGKIASYAKWPKEFSGVVGVPSLQLFSTSGAGTLYPPRCMDAEVFNMENIKKTALNADDLWLKIMQLRKGTPTVLVRDNEKLRIVAGTQEVALQNANVYQDANDKQLKNILDIYDPDGLLNEQIFADGLSIDTQIVGIDLLMDNQYGTLGSMDPSVKTAQQLEKVERELDKIQRSKAYRLSCTIVYLPKKIRAKFRKFRRSGGMKTMINRWVKKIFNK